jgi:hypothetical protein
MNATPFEQQDRETVFSQIKQQLKGLYRFGRHQLDYARQHLRRNLLESGCT